MNNNRRTISKKEINEYLRRTQPKKPRVARRPAFPRPFSVSQVRLHDEQRNATRAKPILNKRVQARIDSELSELIPEHQSITHKKVRPTESYYDLNYSSTSNSNVSSAFVAELSGDSISERQSNEVNLRVSTNNRDVGADPPENCRAPVQNATATSASMCQTSQNAEIIAHKQQNGAHSGNIASKSTNNSEIEQANAFKLDLFADFDNDSQQNSSKPNDNLAEIRPIGPARVHNKQQNKAQIKPILNENIQAHIDNQNSIRSPENYRRFHASVPASSSSVPSAFTVKPVEDIHPNEVNLPVGQNVVGPPENYFVPIQNSTNNTSSLSTQNAEIMQHRHYGANDANIASKSKDNGELEQANTLKSTNLYSSPNFDFFDEFDAVPQYNSNRSESNGGVYEMNSNDFDTAPHRKKFTLDNTEALVSYHFSCLQTSNVSNFIFLNLLNMQVKNNARQNRQQNKRKWTHRKKNGPPPKRSYKAQKWPQPKQQKKPKYETLPRQSTSNTRKRPNELDFPDYLDVLADATNRNNSNNDSSAIRSVGNDDRATQNYRTNQMFHGFSVKPYEHSRNSSQYQNVQRPQSYQYKQRPYSYRNAENNQQASAGFCYPAAKTVITAHQSIIEYNGTRRKATDVTMKHEQYDYNYRRASSLPVQATSVSMAYQNVCGEYGRDVLIRCEQVQAIRAPNFHF